MDYHPTVEDYHQTKMRLFDTLLPKGAPAVVFADDPWSQVTMDAVKRAGGGLLTVGRSGTFITIKRTEHERHRQHGEVEHRGAIYEIDLPLAGEFQLGNALIAAGLAIATGLEPAIAFRALKRL